MKHIFWAAALLFSFCFTANPAFAENTAPISTQIAQSVNSRHPNAHIGVLIKELRNNHILYQHNPNQLFTPASVLKLFTAIAALDYLGENYRFKTEIRHTGHINQGVLKGNVYIKFSGDPTLTDLEITHLIKRLHEKGVKKIQGHVYIDNYDYNNIAYAPGWMWDELTYSYAAPVNAIIINENTFALNLTPAKSSKNRPTLFYNLPDGVITIKNTATTYSDYQGDCPLIIYSNDQNLYRVSGCLYKRWGEQVRKLAIRNPELYAKQLIKNTLNKYQMSYIGTIKTHPTHRDAHLIIEHESKPLHLIIKEMLEMSDNLVTDSLLKKIGENYYHTQGNWQNGLQAIKAILGNPAKINFSKNLVNDGAGLSRYNLIKPSDLVKLLSYAYHKPKLHRELLETLAIAGKEGTLRFRMNNLAASEKVHAKTGSMTGVSSLTGYVKSAHHGKHDRAMMVNGFVGSRIPFIQMEDRIVEKLARY